MESFSYHSPIFSIHSPIIIILLNGKLAIHERGALCHGCVCHVGARRRPARKVRETHQQWSVGVNTWRIVESFSGTVNILMGKLQS